MGSRHKEDSTFRKGLKNNVDSIFAPIVVEIMTRTTMMAYIGASFGGMDNFLGKYNAAFSQELHNAQAVKQFYELGELDQFQDIRIDLEGGQTLEFIAKVPLGYEFTDLVNPTAEFLESAQGLQDGQKMVGSFIQEIDSMMFHLEQVAHNLDEQSMTYLARIDSLSQQIDEAILLSH